MEAGSRGHLEEIAIAIPHIEEAQPVRITQGNGGQQMPQAQARHRAAFDAEPIIFGNVVRVIDRRDDRRQLVDHAEAVHRVREG